MRTHSDGVSDVASRPPRQVTSAGEDPARGGVASDLERAIGEARRSTERALMAHARSRDEAMLASATKLDRGLRSVLGEFAAQAERSLGVVVSADLVGDGPPLPTDETYARCRVLYAPDGLDAALSESDYDGVRCEVKVSSAHLPTMMVVDRRLAVLQDRATRHVALVVRAPALVAAVHAFFNEAWGRALPLTTYLRQRELLEMHETHQVLECLASGLTDARAAETLEMSLRTYHRRLAALKRSLGASSRFEVGARMAQCSVARHSPRVPALLSGSR